MEPGETPPEVAMLAAVDALRWRSPRLMKENKPAWTPKPAARVATQYQILAVCSRAWLSPSARVMMPK